jgi:hypothetical protein
MRRKQGSLVPLEQALLAAAVELAKAGRSSTASPSQKS